jgi:hypothetical protein
MRPWAKFYLVANLSALIVTGTVRVGSGQKAESQK